MCRLPLAFLVILVLRPCVISAEHHSFEWIVEDWVVDFLRPTADLGGKAKRQTPFKIPEANRKGAILVNGQYPGPTVEVFENDTVSINVVNGMISESTSIHWHGIHPHETPWTDGTVGVTQAPIGPGQNYTYTFKAWPAGTHYWHSHMDGMQSAKGLRGAFLVKERDVAKFPKYDEDKLVILADEWQNPEVCLKLEGAMAGNDVCSDIDYASVNGQVAWGDLQKPDLSKYPYPLIAVDKGKCYRMRFIMMASNAENYIVKMAGHDMTLIALDGVPVRPLQITTLNMHIGERADVIVCADQEEGYYPMEMTYDYACSLTPGHFIPPGFHAVSSCNFYAFLKYSGMKRWPFGPKVPSSPSGTGGGKNPRTVEGVPFDLTKPGDWKKTGPVENEPLPAKADVSFTVSLGLNGPLYDQPTDQPMRHGRWYMDVDGRRKSWEKPLTPLLHTKNKCGTNGAPVLDIPEDAQTVEIVLNNLSPTAHNIHMHGMLFQVVNIANFEWCNVNRTDCFLMPKQLNPCPSKNRRWADENHTSGLEDLYWGCAYDPEEDVKTQNLDNPLLKDSFQLWQRSWAVIRFQATFPGVWQFHCHMEQHIPLGMIFAVNVLPSKQPPIPHDVPTEGPCPVWSGDAGRAMAGDAAAKDVVVAENAMLKQRVKDLEKQLEAETALADKCHATPSPIAM